MHGLRPVVRVNLIGLSLAANINQILFLSCAKTSSFPFRSSMTVPPSPQTARLYLIIAACLWSFGGAFTKILSSEESVFNWTGLASPRIDPLHIAIGRTAACALFLSLFLRRPSLTFHWAMIPTALAFALMNGTYVTAMVWGSAAHAVLLQYTAPFWLVAGSWWLFGDHPKGREVACLLAGVAGVAIIVLGPADWESPSKWEANLLALASGFFFAGVLLGLRYLNRIPPLLLTCFNMGLGTLLLLPLAWSLSFPSVAQTVYLIFFGIFQLGLPYILMAHGLKTIKPTEAGLIALLEPLLNPIWAWMVCPATESVDGYTAIGGAVILGSLAFRYLPSFRKGPTSAEPTAPYPIPNENRNSPQP